jgi:general L-amino acid transport system permease protein
MPVWSWLTLLLCALPLFKFVDWAVFKAVFRPDLAACQALAHGGACWGVIAEKGQSILLGSYPVAERWRPALCLALTLGVAALSLASLWRWGGFRLSRTMRSRLLLVWLLTGVWLMSGGWGGLSAVPVSQWGGLPLTLALTVLSLALSLPLAIALAFGRRTQARWLSWPCTVFIEAVRGVPMVTLLFMAAFMLPTVFPATWQPSLFARVGGTLVIFSAAYLAEIVRAGLQTVPVEQTEAAQVLGLTVWRIQQKVVLPQALRAVLPALVSHTIGLVKDTSLVMVVSVHELTGSLGLSLGGDADWRPFYLEAYLFVAAIYGAMCWLLALVGRRLEAQWPR